MSVCVCLFQHWAGIIIFLYQQWSNCWMNVKVLVPHTSMRRLSRSSQLMLLSADGTQCTVSVQPPCSHWRHFTVTAGICSLAKNYWKHTVCYLPSSTKQQMDNGPLVAKHSSQELVRTRVKWRVNIGSVQLPKRTELDVTTATPPIGWSERRFWSLEVGVFGRRHLGCFENRSITKGWS